MDDKKDTKKEEPVYIFPKFKKNIPDPGTILKIITIRPKEEKNE